MRSIQAAVFASLFVMLAARVPAYGWADDGHKIVGEIAWAQMTPEARAAVTNLLAGEAPLYRSLAGAATWADAVRKEPAYQPLAVLHFVNIAKDQSAYDEARDCPGGRCIVVAITSYAAVLRDPAAAPADRAEALKFVAHLVGDIHQPWHVGNREDRGGNQIPARYSAFWVIPRASNVHALWDYALVKRAMHHRGWRRTARAAAARITPDQRTAWSAVTDPAAWADESRRIFVDERLDEYPAGAMLDKAYCAKYVPVVTERLEIAGTRLASLLNDIFAPPKTP